MNNLQDVFHPFNLCKNYNINKIFVNRNNKSQQTRHTWDGEDISAKSIFDYQIEKKHYPKLPLNDLPIILQVGIGRMKPICLFNSLLLSLLGKDNFLKPLVLATFRTSHPSKKCQNPSIKCLFPSEKCLGINEEALHGIHSKDTMEGFFWLNDETFTCRIVRANPISREVIVYGADFLWKSHHPPSRTKLRLWETMLSWHLGLLLRENLS